MKITVVVAAHKAYWMPEDAMYLPVRVGAEGKETFGYTPDSTGDNISAKNANYCELTGLYWAWKNLQADYLGLVHYRRHFSSGSHFGDKRERVMSGTEAEYCLKETEILLPRPRHYWIETNYSQYAHAHHAADLDTARAVIAERCPEYLAAFDAVMKRRKGHRFNMFIMRRSLLDEYCAWLFDILFELERRLDISAYSENDRRVFGFVGERLLDVWLETKGTPFQELPYVFMENQNWLKKGAAFLQRKMRAGEKAGEKRG